MSYESARSLSAIPFALLMACGSSSGSSPLGSGGTQAVTGSGGTVSTGGATSGGATGSGGAMATGTGAAIASSGGMLAAGGVTAAGGKASAGGMAATAGATTGGAKATGGASTSGGAPSAGAGSGGASAGAGGTSPGCGSANATSSCSKSGTPCSIDVSGTARAYYVQLPSSYSSSKAYPVVFQFHPLGGSAEQALNMYRISTGLPEAIYVTPQGLVASGNNAGWANTNGRDIAFTKAMLSNVQANYCVDNSRIFSAGFSYGGMMSFAVGCEMSDVFRAIAPMAGALYSDPSCKGTGHAIAMWGSHGTSDSVVPIADGRAALDKILKQNHCGTATMPIEPSPCVTYQGCDAGYPVTWCEWDGDHGIPKFGSSAIAAFFKQF